tara:strand:+ start:307 stop:534 length:228 start_codon:yes stop_codon:yes gene_type:complete
MKTGYQLFSEYDIEMLMVKTTGWTGWLIEDDDWIVDLLSSPLKKQDWDVKDFLSELEKMKDDKKTFDEVADFFWV